MKLSKLKNKKKFIIGVVIGIVVVNIIGIAGAIAASVTSDVVLYDSPTGKKNVKDAIDELYTMANQMASNCPNGYACTKIPSMGDITTEAPSPSDTHLGIAYFDPTNLSTSCNASNSAIGATGTNSGCMKWYVYKEDSNYYYAILDHNTTAKVSSFSAAQTKVTADTSSWVSNLNPRNITANEIAGITGNTSWSQSSTSSSWFYFDSNSQTQTATSQGASKYAWLYDYTKDCTSNGCNTDDSSTNGYWTSDYDAGDSSNAWFVHYSGMFDSDRVSITGFGVRPVVTISKS